MSMNLKEQLMLLKSNTKNQTASLTNGNTTGSTFIQYKNVIKENIKKNKEAPLFKQFKNEINNVSTIDDNTNKKDKDNNRTIDDILSTGPIKKPKIDESIIKEDKSKLQEELQDIDNNKDKDRERDSSPKSTSQKKEYKMTINPLEIITEIKEQDTTKRLIDVDKYSYDFKCDELYNWFHITFIEWEKELEEVILSDPELAKSRMGIYKQCRGYIKTLLIHLKEKTVTKVILDKLFQVMVFCMDGDYIRAHDNYIELSIGNAPWPMGVTMVGIHERSGRSKIYTSQVAYILNDDITKKYLQSVKRIMTFIQRRFPKSPSKCVFS